MPVGEPLDIRGAEKPGLVTKNGLVLFGNDGKAVSAFMFGSSFYYLGYQGMAFSGAHCGEGWKTHGARVPHCVPHLWRQEMFTPQDEVSQEGPMDLHSETTGRPVVGYKREIWTSACLPAGLGKMVLPAVPQFSCL